MNVLEKKRGITLIALVITIITILILAGVSINLIIGKNGIVERAQTTGKIQTVASIKEALELEKGDLLVNSKTVNLNNYLDQISNGDKKYEISSKEIIDDKNAEIIVDDKYKFALKDTEEGDVEVTYQGVAASSDLSISAKSGTYVYPNGGTFTVTNNATRGELTVSSDATNIATATIEGNTVTVVPGTTAGKANIIVKSSANGDYAENKVVHVATVQNGTIELSVTPYTGIYDGKAHDAITKINVNPTDAKIEYSIDGENYSETVPTITETSSFTVTVRASKAGYKTQSTTETVKVNKVAGKLTLSATSGTINYPNSTTFTVSENTGTLSVSSSDTSVATVSISESTVTVKSVAAGTATITVKSAASTNYNEKTATYAVTVKYPTFTEDSGVGYYADTDGDGTPDGIIFEDFKKGGSGSWGGTNYTISTVTGLKEYYVSKTNYNGPFGTKNVLSATGSGNARFKVMALSDYNDGETYRADTGKDITFGEWSTPTKNLWAAFCREIGITSRNYRECGLNSRYWSSSVVTPRFQRKYTIC
jgi:competence protein ComGC